MIFHQSISALSALPEAARALLEAFRSERLFAFYGKMGAGKTTFIKALCSELGVTDPVTSPTFALINEYRATEGTVAHFDFYRLKNLTEAMDIGTDEYFSSGNYCFMEWPELIESLLPDRFVKVELSTDTDEVRTINAVINQ
ncbi:MAG: tRNA (adenosine(37)-N6)-threonylcarbamoyltransferase complex ATPase subunit type 1 TsaE [Bacteroidales bacterium]|jgi:tRNA threonylcarbamoyladenosine biosynthesis protein TsaE|nr:tRNA (adenosine(37)-N6)-threonylcarbamoyltransferase complex ATPase subunit type 1 TsaE [Bacteroidales bacterium]